MSEAFAFREEGSLPFWSIRFAIKNISDIDTQLQRFKVRYVTYMFLHLSESEYKQMMDLSEEFVVHTPQVMPYNVIEAEHIDPVYTTEGSPWRFAVSRDQKAYAAKRWHTVATFSEPFELENFPFDVQAMQMQLNIETWNRAGKEMFEGMRLYTRNEFRKDRKAYDCEFGRMPGIEYVTYFVEPQGEYSILKEYTTCSIKYHSDYHKVIITLWCRRHWQFYAWRMLLVLLLITLATSAAPVFLDFDNAYTFVGQSLLTTVAYLYIVSSYLPVLKTNTLLDFYIYGSVLFCFFMHLELVIMQSKAALDDDNISDEIKFDLLAMNFGILAFVNLCFLIRCIYAYRQESKKLILPEQPEETLPNVSIQDDMTISTSNYVINAIGKELAVSHSLSTELENVWSDPKT